MKIQNLTNDKYNDYIKFNSKAYPHRTNLEERFNFQFIQNPLLLDKAQTFSLLAYNEEGDIIGEYGVNPFRYHFNNKLIPCFCGCDLFVVEQYRPKGIGSLLSIKAIKTYKPHISIGISKDAYPILSVLKMKEIGEVYIYLWLRSISGFFQGALSFVSKGKLTKKNKPKKISIFPRQLSVNNISFEEINDLREWDEQCFDSDVFEFSRSVDFINWRFSSIQNYHLYISQFGKNKTYFVVKEIYWKGMHLLALVDYRISIKEEDKKKEMFNSILKATKIISKHINCHGVVTMSSHSFFDQCLGNNLFSKVGRPYIMMVNGDLDFQIEEIIERKTAYITMADSDLEFAFN